MHTHIHILAKSPEWITMPGTEQRTVTYYLLKEWETSPSRSSPPMVLLLSAAVSFIRSSSVNTRHLSSSHSGWRDAEPQRALLTSHSAKGEGVETQPTRREHSASRWTQTIQDLSTTLSHFHTRASPWLLTPPPYLILCHMENEIAFYFIHFLHYLHVISTTTAQR